MEDEKTWKTDRRDTTSAQYFEKKNKTNGTMMKNIQK